MFRQFKPILVGAICDSISGVSLQCHSKGLINETYDRIQQGSKTDKEKATMLVDAIETMIVTVSNHYYTFTDILKEELPSGAINPITEMANTLESMAERACTDLEMTKEGSIVDVPLTSSVRTSIQSKRGSLKRKGCSSRESYSRSGSVDSGISIGRSDSSLSVSSVAALNKLDSLAEAEETECTPSEETQFDDKTNKMSNVSSEGNYSEVHTMADQLSEVAGTIWNLRNDALQNEARESCLKKNLDRLRKERDQAISEKNEAEEKKTEAEETVRATKEMLLRLKIESKTLKRKLSDNSEETDGLRDQLSTSKAEKEKLAAQVKKKVDIITKLKADIETKNKEIEEKDEKINDLQSKICQLECRDMDEDTGPEVRRSVSNELREEIKKKDIELFVKEAERKAAEAEVRAAKAETRTMETQVKAKENDLKAKDREIKATKAQVEARDEELDKKCRILYVLVAIIGVIVAVVVYILMYRDSICLPHNIIF